VAIHSLVFPRGQGRVLLYTRRCCHGAWANKAELRASRPQLPEGRPTLEDGLRLKGLT
jgi:hypothetical protein